MASTSNDTLASLERHRQRLEEQVAKLRKSLQHWQTWEFEYEGLREEIMRAGSEPTTEQMIEVGTAFGGELVNEKEIKELVGFEKGPLRSAEQVCNLIARRVDYVQQNVRTVQKQLDTAEKKLQTAIEVTEPMLNDEHGLPLTEIREELDEEGNVLSHELTNPGRAGPQIIDALRKAGLTDLDGNEDGEKKQPEKDADSDSKGSLESGTPKPAAPQISASENVQKKAEPLPQPKAEPVSSSQSSTAEKPKKKGVSFAEKTEEREIPARHTPLEKTPAASRDINFAHGSFYEGSRIYELDDDDNLIGTTPIIPKDESPEDAELRREMLQYSLSEVGAVVAEIDLDEGSDWDDDDDYEYDEDEEMLDNEESEEEDQFGRSTRPVITEDYRKEMLALEEKLNARMLENLGPRPEGNPLYEYATDLKTLRIQKDDEFEKKLSNNESSGQKEEVATMEKPKEQPPKALQDESAEAPMRKGVRFADSLDISSAPESKVASTRPMAKENKPVNSPISDTVVERAPTAPSAPASASKPAKVSRFKAARKGPSLPENPGPASAPSPAARGPSTPFTGQIQEAKKSEQPRYTPEGPPGRTLAPQVIERDVPEDAEPPDEDGLDPALLQQEVATEYYRLRNKMIQQQEGGFMPSLEEKEAPLMEETPEGKVKKVSRFKAARLGKTGFH